jgi:uncharacterized protein (TIGR00251 family)
MSWYRWDGEDLLLTVQVQPRAPRDELMGPQGDALKVRITAPPVDGKANEHLLRFLAGAFGVGRSAVRLVAGQGARRKALRICGPLRLPPLAGFRSAPPRGAGRDMTAEDGTTG